MAAKKGTAKQTKAAAPAPAPAKKESKVFVFFNCDEAKSGESKNIFFNHEVYKDIRVARTALWKKVETEMKENRVHVAEENLDKLQKEIMDGDPTAASQYMQFGAIDAFDCI